LKLEINAVHFADRVLEREVVSDGKRCRELLGDFLSLLFSVSSHPCRPDADAIKNTPLCIARTLQAVALSGFRHAFHTKRSLCTGLFPFPVGVVGNLGRFTPLTAEFSKSPQLHSFVLENLALMQTSLSKPVHPSFHFSSLNYGYYYLFSLFFYVFPNTRRSAIPAAHDRPSRLLARSSAGMDGSSFKSPESREVPLFSTRILT
jgi:hypothetical protein